MAYGTILRFSKISKNVPISNTFPSVAKPIPSPINASIIIIIIPTPMDICPMVKPVFNDNPWWSTSQGLSPILACIITTIAKPYTINPSNNLLITLIILFIFFSPPPSFIISNKSSRLRI